VVDSEAMVASSWDKDFRINSVNQRFAQLWGYTADQLKPSANGRYRAQHVSKAGLLPLTFRKAVASFQPTATIIAYFEKRRLAGVAAVVGIR